MAVVQNPFLSAKARGSVGGITATRANVGAVMKLKARSPLRNRGAQPKVRSIMGWVSRQYGSLTSNQRDEWEAYATDHPYPDGFGGTFILTPEQMFIALNVVAVHMLGPGALQTSPPVDPPVASTSYVEASNGIASGEVELEWVQLGTGVAEDRTQISRAGPFQSPGRVEIHNRYRETTKVAGNVLTYTYEGLVPEMYYWFRVRYVDQYGQKTNWVIVQHKAPTV
ncbi:hypothetical protein ES703_45575 [subsurface metagenome]